MLEKDLLEAIIALPNGIFYNTAIPTYILIITNRKEKQRKGKVQLINANGESFYSKKRKPLGDKRNELTKEHLDEIYSLYNNFKETQYSKIFDIAEFGYTQITVHRPERDEQGNIVYAGKGKPKSNSKLKDTENIPLKQNIQTFFNNEVLPYLPDAWFNKDENKIGYEINFNKYYYQYQAPRPLSTIAADLLAIEKETENLLNEIVNV